jgi:hypothetical protein
VTATPSELIVQWRELANKPNPIANDYNAGQQWAYAVAAAELESALADVNASVAVPQEHSGAVAIGFVCPNELEQLKDGIVAFVYPEQLPSTIPAFTHPAPVAVGVDEAMVLRAIQGWDDYRNDPKDGFTYRGQFRAALLAAMEAKPHV